ncbi:MAG: glycosyltransferase family 9 protein [Candidatus Competibacteraceae bacterium]|nr:glycosyltransferase family 9 protein [Candidatus Competibacteraceae bacterium]MCB1821640.1 glycosyltransferase family 9 protein [Candidatus Competibacteraceae bacterium]HRY16436.1 glycosyltransferase family 9 protein [Candidatus Competibacteraceae bacterium]
MTLALSGRTLIVQPLPGIGDMVWHLPHIHAIAATTMTGQVDILTKPRSQADRLLSADPCVGRILWLERDAGHAGVRGVFRLAALLRRANYQRVWFLHASARYVLAAWLARISERIGYGIGLQPWLLSTPVKLPAEFRHASPIVRGDALLDILGIPRLEPEPRLPVLAAARCAVAERFADWPQPWIALGIGSSEPWKQWGAMRFTELALALSRHHAGSVFIVGGPGERALADEILRRMQDSGGVAADAVALPLEQTAALFASSRCYIGNDTGVLNMAAALRTPALGLFGGSLPLTHSRFIHAITPPAGQSGMTAITVARVLEAFVRIDQEIADDEPSA